MGISLVTKLKISGSCPDSSSYGKISGLPLPVSASKPGTGSLCGPPGLVGTTLAMGDTDQGGVGSGKLVNLSGSGYQNADEACCNTGISGSGCQPYLYRMLKAYELKGGGAVGSPMSLDPDVPVSVLTASNVGTAPLYRGMVFSLPNSNCTGSVKTLIYLTASGMWGASAMDPAKNKTRGIVISGTYIMPALSKQQYSTTGSDSGVIKLFRFGTSVQLVSVGGRGWVIPSALTGTAGGYPTGSVGRNNHGFMHVYRQSQQL